MKSAVVVAGVILGMFAVSPSFAAKKNFKADIEGSAVGSPGSGTGNFTFDDVTKKLCGKATYTGLTGGDVTVAALKEGDTFTIVTPLTASASPLTVDVTLSDDQIAILETGPVYIAIGNAAHGVAAGEEQNGEVNGELVADPAGVEQPCGGAAPSDAGVSPSPSDAGTGGGVVTPPSGTPSNGGNAPDAGAGGGTPDSGGCSTAGSSNRGTAILLALVAATVVFRTRRNRRA